MRNLKRVLSLTLASVMLLGMMVIGAGAAVDYPDVDEQDNVEAIDVLSTVGIMEGYETGNFQPDKQVTRAEMAAIMSRLLSLNTYVTGTNLFNDVPSWAEGYVSACYTRGIINGYGNGKFGTEDPVTAVQAGAMLMRALGYFQNPADEADGFEVSYIRQAGKIGLYDRVGTTKASDNMTRNQIAQLVLNALQSGMVEPDDSTFSITTPDGFTVAQGATNYVFVVSRDLAVGEAINKDRADTGNSTSGLEGPILDLGEHLYNGDLKLYKDRHDDFWRPSRVWEYKGEIIGTYVKEELLRVDGSMNAEFKGYTVKVTGKTLYDLLGNDIVTNNDWTVNIAIDGVKVGGKTGTADNDTVLTNNAKSYFDRTAMSRTWEQAVGQTGNGVLTQVFVNSADKIVDVVVINTYLAQATADYNANKDEVSLKVYALTKTGSSSSEIYYKVPNACQNTNDDSIPIKITSDDFDGIDKIKKDDIFLVTEANGIIETMQVPEVITAATLTAFSKYNYVVTDETGKINYSDTVEYDMETLDNYTSIQGAQQLKDLEYNIYMDPYGYLIGVKIVEAVNNYIFLTGIDQGSSNLMNKTAEAAGILTDGTFINFSMDMSDSVAYYSHGGGTVLGANARRFYGGPLWNTWCTYTVDSKGVYTLTEIKHENEKSADNKAKAGQYHDSAAYGLNVAAPYTATSDGKVINSKNVSLKAADYTVENYTANTTGKFAYGNDKSVYLVAELKNIVSDAQFNAGTVRMPTYDGVATANLNVNGQGDRVGIIGGVDSITTGINNVDLTVWNAKQIDENVDGNSPGYLPAYSGGTYTLYNNDGYVIAAVIVGEDNGTSKTLVYSHKADGTVKSVRPAYYTETGKKVGATQSENAALTLTEWYGAGNKKNVAGDFVNQVEYIEYAINNNGKTITLYEEVFDKVSNKAPYLKESTLYVNTLLNRGFYVADDVKSVLFQTVNGASKVTAGSSKSELESILENELNKDVNTGNYSYKVSAILTSGHATVVIIHDWVVDGVSGNGYSGSNGITGAKAAIDGADGTKGTAAVPRRLHIGYIGITAPAGIDQLNAIVEDWAVHEANYSGITEPVEGTTPACIMWGLKNSSGLVSNYVEVDTDSDIINGVRVRFVNKAGSTIGNGWEILGFGTSGNDLGDTRTAHWSGVDTDADSVNDAIWIRNDSGYYIGMRTGDSGAWTMSAENSSNSDSTTTFDKDHGVIEISSHDYRVWTSAYDKKYKMNDDTSWRYTAEADLVGPGEEWATVAALRKDYPGTGTVVKITNKASASTYAWLDGSNDDITDGFTYDTRFVAVADTANAGSATVTTVPTTWSDLSISGKPSNFPAPANGAINVSVAQDAGGSVYRASTGEEFDTTGGAATGTISTGVEDVTFSEAKVISIQGTTGNASIGDQKTNVTVTVTKGTGTYKTGGTSTFRVFDNDTFTVKVDFGTKTDFSTGGLVKLKLGAGTYVIDLTDGGDAEWIDEDNKLKDSDSITLYGVNGKSASVGSSLTFTVKVTSAQTANLDVTVDVDGAGF